MYVLYSEALLLSSCPLTRIDERSKVSCSRRLLWTALHVVVPSQKPIIRQIPEKWSVASTGNLYSPSHHKLAAMHASISGHLYSQSDSLGKNPNSFSVSLAVAPPAEPPALAADPDPLVPSPPMPVLEPAADWEEVWEPMPVVTLAFTCRSNCCSSAFLVRWISSHVKEMSPGSFRIGSSTRLMGLKEDRWKASL